MNAIRDRLLALRLMLAGVAALVVWASTARADWRTGRGNSERTGTADDLPGPKTPRVLWAHAAKDDFVASPVVGQNELYVSALGPFNSSSLFALSLKPDASKRTAWTKSAPYLKLPVVSSPAVAGDRLVFGDGMHQTDGAVLHCVRAGSGFPIWQLAVPGKLVHLEGSPTIVENKVIIGGGSAGVLCVDLNRVTLDGKDADVAAVQTVIEKRWNDLLAKYESEKKVDPDFAIPPNEDALPKPAPKLLWQQGRDQWHVDVGVAVVGDRVLAASAFLDAEKLGERCLLCLKSNDGSVRWKSPLRLNPWAGPTVAGNIVLVGGSSIRFDPGQIAGAVGDVVAIDINSGTLLWRKDIAGGVLSSVAVRGDLAVFTATDGRVRGWDVKSGQEKWNYDAGAPFFAAPAVTPDMAYAADLKGIVHAIRLADGQPVWKLNLATDPVAKATGMVYGSPIVAGGRLYVATCQLENGDRQGQRAVVCIGER
jgi:outer membrane protein assembly factor BamB